MNKIRIRNARERIWKARNKGLRMRLLLLLQGLQWQVEYEQKKATAVNSD